jgi:uncharacterized protein YhaN
VSGETEVRTHEPDDLRELKAEMNGLRMLMEERNKWYGERDRDRQIAVDKALAAVEKQTSSAFEAAKEANTAAAANQKEAVLKQEDAQRAYNTSHNDLLRKLDDQNKATMPRIEQEQRFASHEKEIGELEKFRANIEGRLLVWAGILVVASGGVATLLSLAFSK